MRLLLKNQINKNKIKKDKNEKNRRCKYERKNDWNNNTDNSIVGK